MILLGDLFETFPLFLFLFFSKDEMIAKKTAYVEALASQYPKGTPVEDYPFLRRHVVIMDTLDVRHGREIRGLRFGMFYEGGSGSSHRHAALIGCRRHS